MSDRSIELIRAFGDAWQRGDVDALMGFMTDDCEYRASVGPEPGTRYVGRDAVRRGIEAMLRHDAGSEAVAGAIFACGDRVVSEWSYRFPEDGGRVVEVRGCDIFHLDGDKIRCKDAYRKCFD
ncbi:MAG: nuclear transport factor 2 family protein [Acidobacteriota bacterium]